MMLFELSNLGGTWDEPEVGEIQEPTFGFRQKDDFLRRNIAQAAQPKKNARYHEDRSSREGNVDDFLFKRTLKQIGDGYKLTDFPAKELLMTEPSPLVGVWDFLKSVANETGKFIVDTGRAINQAVSEGRQTTNDVHDSRSSLMALSWNQSGFGYPPWAGCPNETVVKEKCLELSTNKWNFLHGPPEEIDFDFDFNQAHPDIIAVLKHDIALKKLRRELVPKAISEVEFWRNYFYRVSLICRANDLLYITDENFSTMRTTKIRKKKRTKEKGSSCSIKAEKDGKPVGHGEGDRPINNHVPQNRKIAEEKIQLRRKLEDIMEETCSTDYQFTL